MKDSKRKIANQSVFILYMLTVVICLSAGASLADDQIIARLTDFSGQVMIKSKGQWGIEPRKNLPLFSQDKVVTRAGKVNITFLDGAVLELRPNSNLLIQEIEEGDPATKTNIVKRKLRLLLGKFLFRTGKLKDRTVIQTPTAVCGLRGTEIVVSLDSAGLPYLQFIEGGPSYSIGDFITGVAQDVPVEIADLNPAQKAALIAYAAAKQAKQALIQAKSGEITDDLALLKAAEAAEAAAREAKAAAEAMLNNPDPEIQAEARMAIIAAEKAIKAAQEAQEAIKKKMEERGEILPSGDAEGYTNIGENGPPQFPDSFPNPPSPPYIPPENGYQQEEVIPALVRQVGGGDLSNGFWLKSDYDDNTTTLRFLTPTTFGTGIGLTSSATVEDLGNGAWQPAQGEWDLTETPIISGVIPDMTISHIGLEEGGRYEYPAGNGYYEYRYLLYLNYDRVAITTDSRESEFSGYYNQTITYYESDGTKIVYTKTYTAPGIYEENYSDQTWDPEAFDPSQLATSPADVPGSIKTRSYSIPTPINSGSMKGLLGLSGDPWMDNSPVHAMGSIVNDGHSIFYGEAVGDSFEGLMGGVIINGDLEALLSAVAVEAVDGQLQAGILSGKWRGQNHEGISIFDLDGLSDWTIMNENISFDPFISWTYNSRRLGLTGKFNGSPNSIILMDNSRYEGYGDFGDFETITIMDDLTDEAENWGIFGAILGGTFENPDMATNWQASLSDGFENYGTLAGSWNISSRLIKGNVAGAWVDLEEAMTGVFGGEVIGDFVPTAFDPTRGTWQAVASGTYLTTNKFLDMAAIDQNGNPMNPAEYEKLQKLNIPYIQVGETSLSYTGASGPIRQVDMNNVKFFAYSTGEAPRIWATNNITGTAVANDLAINGAAVQLNDSGNSVNSVTATFQMNTWGGPGGNWDASIKNGDGIVNNYQISIKGCAAGTVANTPNTDKTINFSGTGAGTTEAQP